MEILMIIVIAIILIVTFNKIPNIRTISEADIRKTSEKQDELIENRKKISNRFAKVYEKQKILIDQQAEFDKKYKKKGYVIHIKN